MAGWVSIANKHDIDEGACAIGDVDGVSVAVFNLGGKFHAVENMCTHDGVEFCEGQKAEGQSIVCPWHGARFSIVTGEIEAPPAYEPLTTFPVQILEDGTVQVKDERWD